MIRPVDAEISQRYGDNPTKDLPADNWLIQTFGNYQPDGHSGEDYACKAGTPVRAVTDGTVLHIGWMGGGYADNPWWIMPSFAGYVAVIDHGSFIGIYGHCKDGSAKVSKGDRVTEGQVFVLSGNTGASTGDHLHFEILPDQYVLRSTMYGRTDPETLFTGSMSYASESIQEDDMFEGADRTRLETIEGTVKMLAEMVSNVAGGVNGIPSAILDKQIPRATDPKSTTSLALFLSYSDADREATLSRIKDSIASIPAPDLAAQISAAGLAAAVRDELVKLLEGSK